MDQMISESNSTRVESFIGRKSAPSYRAGDTYITEPTQDRQNYQLEPSVVVSANASSISFYNSYQDLLQSIDYYGGISSDHSRLFTNEAYNFDGCFDIDKFVNFTQYLWLPNGPPAVAISSTVTNDILEYTVTRDLATNSYRFTGNDSNNPILTLVKGNTYKFHVSQPGNPFWIQTSVGITGTEGIDATALKRTILGLESNGQDQGTIVFKVPLSTAQDDIVNATLSTTVDFATDLSYNQVQSHLITLVQGGIDGVTSGLDGKTLIFLNHDQEQTQWTDPGNFDHYPFDEDAHGYEYGLTIAGEQRFGVFRIRLEDVGLGRKLVNLEYLSSVEIGHKVFVRGGKKYANVEFIKNQEGFYEETPVITAPLEVLHYQDDTDPYLFGTIKLIDPLTSKIDVESDILGKASYTSLNGVTFSNGMVVQFDNSAVPAQYANNSFVVEGVGRSISLISTGDFMVPEAYAVADQLVIPDYITVNRASLNLNAWSRSNRWFHSDILYLASQYNRDPALTNIEALGAMRAVRPIIEFDPDLFLFNHGIRGRSPVDLIDFIVQDAFKEVEGQPTYTVQLPNNKVQQLTPGTRIIFANDLDPEVRNKIYRVEYAVTSESSFIHLVSESPTSLPLYEVSGALVTYNIEYDSIPTVTAELPLPGIHTMQANGTVTLASTGIQTLTTSQSGINYVADPYVRLNIPQDADSDAAALDLVYRSLYSIDYIKIETAGLGYTDISPGVSISDPNQYWGNVFTFVGAINLNSSQATPDSKFLRLSDVSDTFSGVAPGMQVVGPGIVGGTTIASVDHVGKLITLSIPALIRNETTAQVGFNTIYQGERLVFVSMADTANYFTVTSDATNSKLLTVTDTSNVMPGMILSGGNTPIQIAGVITSVVPTRVQTTIEHGLTSGDFVLFSDIAGPIGLNNTRFYVKVITPFFVDLYNDALFATAQDSRNYSPYVSGGLISSYTLDYGHVKIDKVIDGTHILTDTAVTVKAGLNVAFAGVPASATARSNGSSVYAVTVVEPGAGYNLGLPAVVTLDAPAAGVSTIQATATAVKSHGVLEYYTVTDPGTGYRFSNDMSVELISSAMLTVSDTIYNGSTTLQFASVDEISFIQPGWLVFLVVTRNGQDFYCDFAGTPYSSSSTTGPDPDSYRFVMDPSMTDAVVFRVDSIDLSLAQINLVGPDIHHTALDIRDSDGFNRDLPAGTRIFVSAQDTFFTSDGYGSSASLPLGNKSTFITRQDTAGSKTIAFESVLGIQPGMAVQDLSSSLVTGILVTAVDAYTKTVTVSKSVTIPAGSNIKFDSAATLAFKLVPAKLEQITFEDPGRGYTRAPQLTISPLTPSVEYVASSIGAPYVVVPIFTGIVVGAKVTSDYDSQGTGVTTGSSQPRVTGFQTIAISPVLNEYRVILDHFQPAFTDRLVKFTHAAEAVAVIANTNGSFVNTTIEDIVANDTVVVGTPTNIDQLKTGVATYYQFWFDGNNWLPAQQKTAINQSPLFDAFDPNGHSASDTDVYPASRFVGTKIFGYALGSGSADSVLGIPLRYLNFNNVGDIVFYNYFQSDTFDYLSGFTQKSKGISSFKLKQLPQAGLSVNSILPTGSTGLIPTSMGYVYRNVWTKVSEQTRSYQIIEHVFDGTTNYFEIDILPEPSTTIPNMRVYVDNRYQLDSAWRQQSVGGRLAVVIDAAQLTVGDRVRIEIFSRQKSQLGYYHVPVNMELNPLNEEFSQLTLGQIRNHLNTMTQNHYGLQGPALGANNLRDLYIKNWQGSILQHAQPAAMASLFLNHDDLNSIKAIEFAANEYTRFKTRFLDTATKIEIDVNDIPAAVDLVMESIMLGKSDMSPWYDSDMVPYGTNQRTVTDIPVLNVAQKVYLIPQAFDPNQLGLRTVLIYLRDSVTGMNRQLIRDVEFTFDSATATITIMDNVPLAYTQRLTVVDYKDTSGCYVPETPTKLGIYPKFTPTIYMDDTYRVPVLVIQGHDGSITPAFGDFRDQLLLELELRIYNGIKTSYISNGFATGADVYDLVPGKFRDTGYSRQEYNRLLTKNFLRWIGSNRLDYSTNSYFNSNDAFTWNYNAFTDADGTALPGYWRGIYKWYYDTDRPHTAPWEMLGLSEKPDWWDGLYGSAPYTSGNGLLWSHMEQGIIAAGLLAGPDPRFARPGLSKFLPVDENGNLRPPQQIMVAQFNSQDVSGAYAVGDHGPVESAWRRSSDFPYSVQIAGALAVPAFYFAALFDVSRYYHDNNIDQYLFVDSQSRLTAKKLTVPDSGLRSGTSVLTAGYINWVRDYLVYRGFNPTEKIRSLLDNLQVRLSYKAASFTDKRMLEVAADQSSPTGTAHNIIIPNENYTIQMHKGSPLKRLIYSAVIVEKTNNGWTVSGYNLAQPYFQIIPSVNNNNAYSIGVLDLTATVFRDFQLRKVIIPYGFEIKSYQAVVDFLVAYQRSLLADGFLFDDFNTDLSEKQDWILSAKEFLTWVQQGWKTGSILVLSAAGDKIRVSSASGVVDEITNEMDGSKILDQNFNVIRRDSFSVLREGNDFSLQSLLGQTIGLADIDIVEYEHALIFDNTTVFNDVIFSPSLGYRQGRLKLIGYKSGSWTGALTIPGYIYNDASVDEWVSRGSYRRGSLVQYKTKYYLALKNVPESTEFDFNYWQPVEKDSIRTGLLPNFSLNADKARGFYDGDSPSSDHQLAAFSSGLIGFRERSYFTDLNLDNTSQLKFYQGFIKQKGTMNAITSLTSGVFDNVTSEINIYEEWALRVGDYGAAENNQFLELILQEGTINSNPALLNLVADGGDSVPGAVNFSRATVYRTSEQNYTNTIIPYRSGNQDQISDLVNAGYPRLDDVNGTIYDISNYQNHSELVENMGAGYRLWTAVDFNKSWNVYRVTETDLQVQSLTLIGATYMQVVLNGPHYNKAGDLIVIKNFYNGVFNGIYRITSVIDNNTVQVPVYKGIDQLKIARTIGNSSGIYLKLISVRFSSVTNIINFTPPHGWRNNDRAWIDNDLGQGVWGVFKKTDGWDFNQLLPVRKGDDRYLEGFGRELKINNDNQVLVTGLPGYTTGSLVGVKVIDPGQNYVSPRLVFSAPEAVNGVLPSFAVERSTGVLLGGTVTSSGSGYTLPPIATITDQYSAKLAVNTLNHAALTLVHANISHVFAGDMISGSWQGILDGWEVTTVNTTTNVVTIQPAGSADYPFITSATTFTMSLAQLGTQLTFNADTRNRLLAVGLEVTVYMTSDTGKNYTGTVASWVDNSAAGSITILITDVNLGSSGNTSSSWLIETSLYVPSGNTFTVSRGTLGSLATQLTPTYIESIQIIDAGTNISSVPTIEIVGGGGTGAAAYLEVVNGSITNAVVSNPGSGYTSEPEIYIYTNNTSVITLRAKLAPTSVASIIVTNAGQDYREPALLITNDPNDGGYGAAISITSFYSNSGIQSVHVDSRGHGYKNATTTLAVGRSLTGSGFSALVTTYGNGAISGVTISTPGSGYSPSANIIVSSSGGSGATGTLNITQNGISNLLPVNLGLGYINPPTITVIDDGSDNGISGSGAVLEPIFTTGRIRTFLRPDQNSTGLEQTEYIQPFSTDAREFGYSVDIGTLIGLTGSPGSFNQLGGVLISRCLGSQWASQQMLFPPDILSEYTVVANPTVTSSYTPLYGTSGAVVLNSVQGISLGDRVVSNSISENAGVTVTFIDALNRVVVLGGSPSVYAGDQLVIERAVSRPRFGHSVAISRNEDWIYVGAPGINRVYCYGKKDQTYPRITLTPTVIGVDSLGHDVVQTVYFTNLLGLTTAYEVKIVGEDGKVYEPVFDYDVDAAGTGEIFFRSNLGSELLQQGTLYVQRQRLNTTVKPIVLQQVLQRTYQLASRPESVEQLLVFGATGRVFVPYKEYDIVGKNIVFLTDDFISEPSIIVQQKDQYYKLVDTLSPTDGANPDAQFGWSVRCDQKGYKIIVGAPNTLDTYVGAGRAYVFNRSYEVLVTLGTQRIYTVSRPFRGVVSANLDNAILRNFLNYNLSGENLILTLIPTTGQRLQIDTNYFNIQQVLVPPTAVNQGRYGQTVDIAQDNHALIVGSPGYRDENYYNGEVYRYVNRGLIYGSITSVSPNFSQTVTASSTTDTVRVTSTADVKIGYRVAFGSVETTVLADYRVPFNSGYVVKAIIDDTTIRLIKTDGSSGTVTVVSGDKATFSKLVVAKNNTIVINDKIVPMDNIAGDTSIVKRNIDIANIVGIDTSTINDAIALSSTNVKIDLQAGVGEVLAKIGMEPYALTQSLRHPRYGVPEKFGVKIKLDESGDTLLISSTGGNTLKKSTFDKDLTQLDRNTTRFIDSLNASGAVYVYDYLAPIDETFAAPGKMIYNQVLQDQYVLTGDNFGSGIDINAGWVLIGADNSNYYPTNPYAGLVHLFINQGNIKGWTRSRQQTPKVDISYVNRVVLYNKKYDTMVEQLDYFDPVKGKILGIADQDIDYKTIYDPAHYTNCTNSALTTSLGDHWNRVQVGATWWDLSLCRYIDYEQGDVYYRIKHWGELFPGSIIQVSEWVRSIYLPSQYETLDGDGMAKYADDSAYVEESYYEESTGLIKTAYYYWVVGKKNFDRNSIKRVNSVVALENIIANPQNQDIPFLAVLEQGAFGIYNSGKYLNGLDIVLRVEYGRVLSDVISHSEYQLIQQGNPLDFIPDKLISKLIDSLSGENASGQVVPDLRLRAADAYGIDMLPRKSMIKNPLSALTVFVSYVNSQLITRQVTETRVLATLSSYEDVPPANVGFYHAAVDTVYDLPYIPASTLFDGFLALVRSDVKFDNYWTIYKWNGTVFTQVRIQSYDARRWWHYVDWYATGYDQYTSLDFTVNRYADTLKLALSAGKVIKVLSDFRGLWALYVVNADLSLTKVAQQEGTVQLSIALFDTTKNYSGFDNAAFDQVGFSTTQSVELRYIFTSVINDLFVGEDKVLVNDLFFKLVNYILSEQPAVDWALKTSLISVQHKIRKLEQFPSYIRDNQDYYANYIDEVKPYRTQVREYLLDYQGTDPASIGTSDFDLPAVYDRGLSRYRVLNPNSAADLAIITGGAANSWLKNVGYSIQKLNLLSGGYGYIQDPRVEITGGGGTGAVARAQIGPVDAQGLASVVEIILDNPGSGYTSQPTVSFIGGGGVGVKAFAQFQDFGFQIYANVVTSATSNIIRSDVLLVNLSSVNEMQTGYAMTTANITAVNAPVITQIFEANNSVLVGPFTSNMSVYAGEVANFMSRVTVNTPNRTIRNLVTTVKFDRTTYTTNIRQWKAYELYRPGDIVVIPDVRVNTFANYTERALPRYNFVYKVMRTLVGRRNLDLNIEQDHTVLQKLYGTYLENANDRIAAYNQLSSPDLAHVFSSPDLVRFTNASINDQIISVGNQWNSMTHAGAVPLSNEYMYAAVGNHGLVGLSRDGIDWNTVMLSDISVDGHDIVLYNKEYWVVVANQGTMFFSQDGVNWSIETVSSYYHDSNPSQPGGYLQTNTEAAIDLTGVAYVGATLSEYLVVAADNGTILVNTRGNTSLNFAGDLARSWYRINVQGLYESQSYLRLYAIDLGLLANHDGTTYKASIAGSSGYFIVNELTGKYIKQGYLFTAGINGAINVISYQALDDVINGFTYSYNYNQGKKGDLGYPWLSMQVPSAVRGLGDNFSGEQINNIAVSGVKSGENRWVVAVGSSGTIIWNRLDSALRVRTGYAGLGADTIDKSVVYHDTYAYDNFRYFDDADFVAPLTQASLDNINFNDVAWDGEKFVVVGNNGTILFGYPGAKTDAYIEITNITGIGSVTMRRPGASWSYSIGASSTVISIGNTDIDGELIVEGMTVIGALPTGTTVTSTHFNGSEWLITVGWDPAIDILIDVTAQNRQVSFVYTLTADIEAGTEITLTHGSLAAGTYVESTVTVSALASRGATRIYISDFAEQVQADYDISQSVAGIPLAARVKEVGKQPSFQWTRARGNETNTYLDYRSIAVNNTTVAIDTPLETVHFANGVIKQYSIHAGDTVTFYDPTGGRIQATATQDLRSGVTEIAIDPLKIREIKAGYTMEANTIMGVASSTKVVSSLSYATGGVLSRLLKDIADLVPNTSYPGVKVLGQEFTANADAQDALTLDTVIQSSFTDGNLGIRPEDIVVSGGKFIDTYSSHAPEELVPGQVIDSLQMSVFTANVVNGSIDYGNVIAYKVFTDYVQNTTYYRLAGEHTTTLAQDLHYTDANIAVTDIGKLPDPNPDLNILGSVWINGERINYLGIDRAHGLLTNIRRGANRTSIPLVHAAGQLIVDAGAEQLIGSDITTKISENTIVNNGNGGSATYLASTGTIPQTRIWQDLT
jgi:hypothetical protein